MYDWVYIDCCCLLYYVNVYVWLSVHWVLLFVDCCGRYQTNHNWLHWLNLTSMFRKRGQAFIPLYIKIRMVTWTPWNPKLDPGRLLTITQMAKILLDWTNCQIHPHKLGMWTAWPVRIYSINSQLWEVNHNHQLNWGLWTLKEPLDHIRSWNVAQHRSQ